MDHSLFKVVMSENFRSQVDKVKMRMEALYYKLEIDNGYLALSAKFFSAQLEAGDHGMKGTEEREMTFNITVVSV